MLTNYVNGITADVVGRSGDEYPDMRNEGNEAVSDDGRHLLTLNQDLAVVWLSELAAAAADRELMETWANVVDSWSLGRLMSDPHSPG